MERIIAQLARVEAEGNDGRLLTFEIPPLKRAPFAGQFFMIKLLDPGFPLFGRALAVMKYAANSSSAEVGFLVKAMGRGTSMMLEAEPGEQALLVGPSGNSFPSLEPGRPQILVAGGTGVAAFHYLLTSPALRGPLEKNRPKLLYGARDASTLYLLDALKQSPADMRIATEDGSAGRKGLVTALLEEVIDEGGLRADTRVFVCGPDPMMKAVSCLCRKAGLTAYLSLEVRMACGFGVCNGCAVEVVRQERRAFERVCFEGPVFPAHLLPDFWEGNPE